MFFLEKKENNNACRVKSVQNTLMDRTITLKIVPKREEQFIRQKKTRNETNSAKEVDTPH